MGVGRRRCLLGGAIGLLVIAALCAWAVYREAYRAPDAARESEWQRKYWAAIAEAEEADEAEHWGKAARLYGEVTSLLPHDPVCRYRRARALAHLDREDEALEELGWAVELGWADVAGLRSDPIFRGICNTARFEELRERAEEIADEPIVVYVPSGLDQKLAPPLVVTFHGLGENPHRHIRSWEQAADRLGVVVAAPRGIERIPGRGQVHSFRWVTAGGEQERRDFRRCRDLLRQSIELAKQRANVDENRVILAGYSQGGSVALALLADAPERFCGAVVQATGYAPNTLETWKQPQPGCDARVYIIVHEFDRMRPRGAAAYQALQDAGIEARLEVVPGADHELPLDNSARQIEAVRYVLGVDSPSP